MSTLTLHYAKIKQANLPNPQALKTSPETSQKIQSDSKFAPPEEPPPRYEPLSAKAGSCTQLTNPDLYPVASAPSSFSSISLDPAPLSSLQRGIAKAKAEGAIELDDLTDIAAFPVIMVPDPINPGRSVPRYEAVDYRTIKSLKEAVHQYGISGPYVQGLLRALALSLHVLPIDWKNIAQMILSNTQYLLFEAAWKKQADRMLQQGLLPVNTGRQHIMGTGTQSTVAAQLQLPRALFVLINEAVLYAFSVLEDPSEVTSSFAKILQGPQEPYAEFVNKLITAVKRQIENAAAQNELIKKLAYENSNADCKSILKGVVVNPRATISDYLDACRHTGTTTYQMSALATALQEHSGQSSQNRSSQTCFNCGKPGHFKAECRAPGGGAASRKDGRSPKPRTICPKCKKGFHWAKDCRSVTNSNQGN